jgi:DNA-binding GntR family transcriptional regulator
MRQSTDRIPDKVLREIFPKKLSRSQSSDEVYTKLRKMILSRKLKRGERLTYDGIALNLNVTKGIAAGAISRLKKDGLIISKWRKGSFVSQCLKKAR